ncbi:MAG: serine/threonine-protein kinase PknK, partial [Okeania sp. SIO2D1]|nr:serine/threonine-protein kinase PknK [Okeania sp. SIO2D1]
MLNLAGYQQTNQIYAGTRTLVYRAFQAIQRQPVIIKVLRNPHPNFYELVQFRNQYIITRHLEHPAIVKPLVLERYGNAYALVMPDDGAIALSDYWQHSEHSQKDFLNIAIQLASALHYLNQQRIVHKDIKPSNILIHPETKQVKLIDFSISSLLPTEQQQLINPNVLEGTLAYISPEQTGRMNRGIDYRTDFYSLGVTFFQLLTGKLPFQSNDPMELVHCHIAQTVSFPIENQVPEVLQEIVLKLMAKNAEERYQSALGLKHDLERCLQQLETIGKITSFELGQRDKSDRFIIPEKLYGREQEVQILLDAFERVATPADTTLSKGGKESPPTPLNKKESPPTPLSKGGEKRVEMMLVAGFSGIGKTAVINEIHKPIVRQRGYFIKGKFDQFNRNIPFSGFVQAFRDLMRQLLSESDTQLDNWKQKILNAVGENGQVLIEVIPELENIIGQQPPVPELSGSAAQNRFNLLFGKFISVFTTKDHPLVIFLDDLQWADLASLKLLKLLMSESEISYLLVLGAYRDNEVFPTHPLMLTLDEIQKQEVKINTITLAALREVDITRLVADTLQCSVENATPLSQLVYQKTKGNPFFTTQFLKGLHEDAWITFDSEAGYWQCDLTQIRQLSLTDDVLEFMVGRLRKLDEATQNVLKLAACIGNQFDLETLAVICEKTLEKVA